MAHLEHANITVSDPQATATLLVVLFDWRIRWQGPAKSGGFTIHVGGTRDYLALYTPDETGRTKSGGASDTQCGGLNHIGVVVDDLDDVEAKVRAHGYVPESHADYEPGRRFYFRDHDGIEFEVVSYS